MTSRIPLPVICPNVLHYAILIHAVLGQICHILEIIFNFCQLTFLLLPSLKSDSMMSHVIYIPCPDTSLLSNIAVIEIFVYDHMNYSKRNNLSAFNENCEYLSIEVDRTDIIEGKHCFWCNISTSQY